MSTIVAIVACNGRRSYLPPVGRKGRPYRTEKARVQSAVVEILEHIVPGVVSAVEVADVSTPATVIRFTGNWRGSMERWLLAPGQGYKPFPNSLSGLDRFVMAGQWVLPGGGLPSGLLTARAAIKAVCARDRVPWIKRD